MTDLRKAAEAVLERWDSPAWEWKKQGPTADLMANLRKALAAEQPVPTDKDSLTVQSRLDAESFREERDEARALLNGVLQDIEALRRDADRWRHWRDSHGFATIDHEGGRCFVTLICDCDDPDQVRAKRFKGEDSFEWLDAFTDAAMKENKR